MNIESTQNGILISEIVLNTRLKRLYQGYTTNQAKRLFNSFKREFIKFHSTNKEKL